jgi:hypothetical protein
MGAPKKPLLYREIQFHGGVSVVISKGKYGIRRIDGLVVPRKDGKGVKAFNEKILARDEARFGSVCRYCGDFSLKLTVDHVVAWINVGDYTNALNTAACCQTCNGAYNNQPKPNGKVEQILRENREMARATGKHIGQADPWRPNDA